MKKALQNKEVRATKREMVYRLIDEERDYQDSRWNPDTTETGGLHCPTEWLVFIEDYLNEAKHIATREAAQTANLKIMDILRKVAAMSVAAMEQNKTPARKK
jgi:hypothetical protein